MLLDRTLAPRATEPTPKQEREPLVYSAWILPLLASLRRSPHSREAQLVAARRVGGGLIALGHKSRSARCQGARDKPTSFSLSR